MWRDRVLQSPKMYVGYEWNEEGLHALLYEVIRLAADPQAGNQSTHIIVTTYPNGSVLIRDNGRGIPIDVVQPWPDSEVSGPAIEVVLTTLFERHPNHHFYTRYGFLDYHGVILTSVSSRLAIETCYQGQWYRLVCSRGTIVERLHPITSAFTSGTCMLFHPDPLVFGSHGFDIQQIRVELDKLIQLHPSVEFTLIEVNSATKK